MLLIAAALAGGTPGWTACNGTDSPLVWADLTDEPLTSELLPRVPGRPSLASEAIREPVVRIDRDGKASAALPKGPVRLHIDPALQAPGLIAVYQQLADAGSEPPGSGTYSRTKGCARTARPSRGCRGRRRRRGRGAARAQRREPARTRRAR